MSLITASNSIRTNDIESVGGGPLDIGRFATGNVKVGSSDNMVSVGDALSIFVDEVNNNYINTIGTFPLLIGTNASEITIGSATTPVSVVSSAISLTGATTVSTTLGVSGITTTTGGLRSNNIDTIGNAGGNGTLTIGGTRAIALNIGKTTYSTVINSGDAFPLRVSNIEAVETTDILKIGQETTEGVWVGGNSPVLLSNALGIYYDSDTNGAYIDTVNGGDTLFIGDNAGVAGPIIIGNTLSSITLLGAVSISTSGTIPTPNASTARVSQAFGTTFTSTLPPKVYLTYDAGATSTNIITVCLAGFVGSANLWTGFYYLTSTSSAGVADSKLNWIAIA